MYVVDLESTELTLVQVDLFSNIWKKVREWYFSRMIRAALSLLGFSLMAYEKYVDEKRRDENYTPR